MVRIWNGSHAGSARQVIGYAAGTYNSGINKGTPAALFLEKGEHKGDGSGTKQNEDELVLELLEDELPERCWGLFRNS
jgi:hypothetical protein